MRFIRFLFFASFLMLTTTIDTSAQVCGTDQRHEHLMQTDPDYAAYRASLGDRIRQHMSNRALDLDNDTLVTVPVVVHVMHTGGAVGTIYNPSDADIIAMIDGMNDFYANDGGNSVDFRVQFELASRDPNCAGTTGIVRYDASGLSGYTAGGVDAGSGTGSSETALKALSKWSNYDYYNIWVVNRIDGADGTIGSFIAGYAYFPGASPAVDGTVILATRMTNPAYTTLTHELGHAMNLYHTFQGDASGTSCPTNTDCNADGDECCDTPPHIRNSSSCPSDAATNSCTATAWNGDQKNIMDYSSCRDRFTSDQKDRFRAALEVARPGLVNSDGDEAPPAATPDVACVPGITNPGNTFGMGPLTFDWNDERSYTQSQTSAGEYLDLSCNQKFDCYPGETISLAVGTDINSQLVRVYIDYNGDGDFDDSGEDVFSSNLSGDPQTHSGDITIPGDANTEEPLRLRVWADWLSSGTEGPCTTLLYGQAVDHALCVENVNVWLGATSTNWSTASNWGKGTVPTSGDDVRIPAEATNQPHVTAAPGSPATCAALEIQSGATLTVDAGKALTVTGNTDNKGTILVKADATGVGSFIDNGMLSAGGSYQMEQYLTGSGGASPNGVFWYVCSPITDGVSTTFDAGGNNRLWHADETTQSYPEITSNGSPLTPGKGYVARVGASASFNYSGSAFNTGNFSTLNIPRTGTSEENRGYNLMGNPYPSSVDWEAATKTNLSTTVWYRTKNGSTMLVDTYNGTTHVGTNNNGGGAVTQHIPPAQAVWVRVDADGNTGTLGFTNADRSHQSVTSIYRMANFQDLVRVSISDQNYTDEHVVLFNSEASDLLDDYDSEKLFGGAQPYLYSLVENAEVTMNGLNNPVSTPWLPLTYEAPEAGDYQINGVEFSNQDLQVLLEDAVLGNFQNLQDQPVYSFSSEAGTFSNRFILHFSPLITSRDNDLQSEVRIFEGANGLNVWIPESIGSVRILDMTGREVLNRQLNSEKTVLSHSVSPGIYLVEVWSRDKVVSRKVKF